jgi:hypothetical protein
MMNKGLATETRKRNAMTKAIASAFNAVSSYPWHPGLLMKG